MLDKRLIIILSLLGITVFGILLFALFLIIKRHSKSKDSKFLTNLKVFLGMEQDKDSISEYFSVANNILKHFLKGSADYKYELPWYISFGDHESGKTAFLANVGLETPIQLDYNDTSYINHYFFNHGIVMDIKTDLIFNDMKNDFCWERFIDKLKLNRPMKALDGIIYFVSLKDLLSSNADQALQHKKNIEVLYQKLWKLQNKFEINLPVYMVFTHLDCIEGFEDFAVKFENYKDDMFGWSNPFSIKMPFDDTWIENFTETLNEEMKSLLSDVMVTYSYEDSFNIMNFINNFQDIYPKIIELLTLTFKSNKYTKGLYLRGVYFSAVDKQSASTEKLPTLDANSDIELAGGYQIETLKVYFAKDLLINKIFAEKDIGQETVDRQLAAEKLKKLKLLYTVFLISSLSYGVFLYHNLIFFNQSLYPKILKLTEVLKDYEKDKNYSNRIGFTEELKIILQYIGDTSQYSLRCKGIPSSLFSSVERAKTNLILIVTKKLVISNIFTFIEKKYSTFANAKKALSSKTKETLINPLHSFEFLQLNKFVRTLYEIEEYEQKFVSFKEFNSFSAFSWLLEHILNVKMPKSFESSVVFSGRMDLNDFDTNKFFEYKKKLKKRFRVLLNVFIVNCFSKDRIKSYFASLEMLLSQIDAMDVNMNYDNLKNLQTNIVDLVDIFNGIEFDWLKAKSFSSEDLEVMISMINGSNLLGGEDTVNELINRTSTSFHSFKKTLSCYQLPLIGAPFYIIDNTINLSNNIIQFQGTLNQLFSESFMEKTPNKPIPKVNAVQSIIWNSFDIKNILETIADYKSFIKKTSKSKLDIIIKKIAEQNIKNLIKDKLLESHKIVTLDMNHAHLTNIAENQKHTMENLLDIFNFINTLDVNLFAQISELTLESLSNYLIYVDKTMQTENLYDLKEEMFILNAKTKTLGFNFNIGDYLLAQKKQLEFFAFTLAQYAILGLEKIYELNNILPDTLFIKWKNIILDLNLYKTNPANSKLYLFEELLGKVQTSNLKELFDKDLKIKENSFNKDLFFDSKLFILHQRLNSVLDTVISKLLMDQYNNSILFYNEYSHAFPFNINGVLIGISGYNKMNELISKQDEVISLIKLIKPQYDSQVFRFIKNLARLEKMISFLMSNDKSLTMIFKPYEPTGDLYEKNLHLIVSCEAKINGQNTLNLYKKGELKIYDLVQFVITLSENSKIKLSKINLSGGKVSKNIITFSFNKHTLMKFLMENVVVINHFMFIRFTINIEDDKGIKDHVIIMIPVELSLEGVNFELPDKAFIKMNEEDTK